MFVWVGKGCTKDEKTAAMKNGTVSNIFIYFSKLLTGGYRKWRADWSRTSFSLVIITAR